MTALLNMQDIIPEPVEPVTIPLGEWLPDVLDYNNPGAIEVLNAIPAEKDSYVPFPQLVSNPLITMPELVRGAAAVINADDVVQLYVGTINGVYTKLGAAITKILSTSSSDLNAWQFIRVNEQMVAVHREHFPLRTPVDTSTTMVTLGGTPPLAACGGQVGDFLMLGNLLIDPDDAFGAFPSRVRWGGKNNIDSPWVTNPVTQADFQDQPAEGGAVVAISGRDVGTVFMERMIRRISYRGLPTVFEFATIEDKRGLIARDAIVDVGLYSFGIAEDGFFVWNGTNSQPIGDGKVNRYFFNKLQYGLRNKIVGAPDFVNGCVMWAFPTDTTGVLNEIIIYSYRENKWSHSIQTLEYLFNSAASNVTLEELTAPLESYTLSFDDPSYRSGGRSRLGAFNDSHVYGLFTGLPMAATFDTGEYSGPDGRRVFVNNARPLVDLAIPVARMRAAMRDQMLGQPILFSIEAAQEIDGHCPLVVDARYMRFRTDIPVDIQWEKMVGVEISRKAGGQF